MYDVTRARVASLPCRSEGWRVSDVSLSVAIATQEEKKQTAEGSLEDCEAKEKQQREPIRDSDTN